jgi:hypothetical protein
VGENRHNFIPDAGSAGRDYTRCAIYISLSWLLDHRNAQLLVGA